MTATEAEAERLEESERRRVHDMEMARIALVGQHAAAAAQVRTLRVLLAGMDVASGPDRYFTLAQQWGEMLEALEVQVQYHLAALLRCSLQEAVAEMDGAAGA